MPSVSSASISSPVFMLPIWAANAAPVRPARTTAAIIGPISRTTREADQVGNEDVGAELPQLHRGLVRHDQADQQADQADDGQGHGAALLHLAETVAPAKPARTPEHVRALSVHSPTKSANSRVCWSRPPAARPTAESRFAEWSNGTRVARACASWAARSRTVAGRADVSQAIPAVRHQRLDLVDEPHQGAVPALEAARAHLDGLGLAAADAPRTSPEAGR